jgi:hypothetical protein
MMKVPALDDPNLVKFLNELLREVDQRDKERLSSIRGNRSLLLYSPSTLVFEVKVSDAGALSVTKVSG